MNRRWLRIGIALSILWAIGAGWHQRHEDVAKAENFASFSDRVCRMTHEQQRHSIADCEDERRKGRSLFMQGSWGNVVAIALLPLPLVLLAAFVVYNVGRIVLVGSREVIAWRSRTRAARTLLVSCFVGTGIVVFVAVIALMNMYVDAQVPVVLPPGVLVSQVGDSVVATGTWIRDSSDSDPIAFPLQTSRILCERALNRCFEAHASLSFGNQLSIDLDEFPIESWSANSIVYSGSALCVDDVYTIDLKTQSVNGAGHFTNQEQTFCREGHGANASPAWKYHLVDGFKVYWEQRQKARPLPLRVIQASFGN